MLIQKKQLKKNPENEFLIHNLIVQMYQKRKKGYFLINNEIARL